MSGGARVLLDEYHNSHLAIAEDLILGNIKKNQEWFAFELMSTVILEAARIRLEAKGLLNKENVH